MGRPDLQPLVDALKEELLAFPVLHADEAPVAILDPGAGKTHARRKFFELQAHGQSQIAREALERIAALYAIEQEARELDTEARQTLRQQKATLLLEAFKAWLLQCRRKIPSASSSAKAIDDTLKRWAALTHYLTDGL